MLYRCINRISYYSAYPFLKALKSLELARKELALRKIEKAIRPAIDFQAKEPAWVEPSISDIVSSSTRYKTEQPVNAIENKLAPRMVDIIQSAAATGGIRGGNTQAALAQFNLSAERGRSVAEIAIGEMPPKAELSSADIRAIAKCLP